MEKMFLSLDFYGVQRACDELSRIVLSLQNIYNLMLKLAKLLLVLNQEKGC